MRVVPKDNQGAIDFFANHGPVWVDRAASIGLSGAQAADVVALAGAARAAFNQQQQLQLAARAATQEYEDALAALRAAGSACIARIGVTARADKRVYDLALLPPPQTPVRPGRGPAPGRPSRLGLELLQTGAVRLSWACVNPRGTAGTVYEVRRADDDGGDFRFIAVTGDKWLVDDTLPAGTALVEYQVTAPRSTRRGTPARHRVRIGGVARRAA